MELKQSIYSITKTGDILLIVPYGIETRNYLTLLSTYAAFNRTLWN